MSFSFSHSLSFLIGHSSNNLGSPGLCEVSPKARKVVVDFVYENCFSKHVFMNRLKLEGNLLGCWLEMVLVCSLSVLLVLLEFNSRNMFGELLSLQVLHDTLELDKIDHLSTEMDLHDFLTGFMGKSRELSPGSDHYIPQESTMLLLPEFVSFPAPSIRSEITIPLQGNFTLTAWVKTRGARSGTIVQKRLDSIHRGPCWRWKYPAGLDFGAADFGINPARFEQAEFYHKVYPKTFPEVAHDYDEVAFVALVVDASTATFYKFDGRGTRDVDIKESVVMPRIVADCDGVVEFGDTGLEIGHLAFRPRALKEAEVLEVLSAGGTFGEIATGSMPRPVSPGGLTASLDKLILSSERVVVQKLDKESQDLHVRSELTRNIITRGATIAEEVQNKRTINITKEQLMFETEFVKVIDEFDFDPLQLHAAHIYGLPRVGSSGNGFSISAWIKFKGASGYIFAKHPSRMNPGRCYSAHVVTNRISMYFQGSSVQCIIPEAHKNSYLDHRAFRHVAFVLQPPKEVLIFLDGSRLCTGNLPAGVNSIADLDGSACHPGAAVAGMRYIEDYKLRGTIKDLRIYVDKSLTSLDVLALANSFQRECKTPDDKLADTDLRNDMGDGCLWYLQQREAGFVSVCSEEIQKMCPVACNTQVPCFSGADDSDTHWAPADLGLIWDRIHYVKKKTICASSEFNRASLERMCHDGNLSKAVQKMAKPGNGNLPAGIVSLNHQEGCQDFANMVDENCAWDHLGKSMDNVPAFSLSFWRKGRRTETFMAFSKHNFLEPAWLMQDMTEFNEHIFAQYSTCDEQAQSAEILDVDAVLQDEQSWNHYMLIANFGNGSGDGSNTMILNGQPALPEANWNFCRRADYFSMLYFEVGGFMSPITVHPRIISLSEAQSMYYKELPFFNRFPGPMAHKAGMRTVEVQQEPFRYRHMLLAPVMVSQDRLKQTDCITNYQAFRARASATGCQAPYLCPELSLNCRDADGKPEVQTFFGTHPESCPTYCSRLNCEPRTTCFRIFGQTIAAPAIRRNLRSTVVQGADFIDIQTGLLTVSAIFYFPHDNMLTNLLLRFDMRHIVPQSVVKFHHISKGNVTFQWTLCILSCLGLSLSILYEIRNLTRYWNRKQCQGMRRWHIIQRQPFIRKAAAAVVTLVLMCILAYTYTDIFAKNVDVDSIVKALIEIPWDDTGQEMSMKSRSLMHAEELIAHAARSSAIRTQCTFVLLCVQVVRVVGLFTVHPRLSLITGTVIAVLDELQHLFICLMIVLAMFSFLAWFTFGSEDANYQSIGKAFCTLIDYMRDEVPQNWSNRSSTFIFFYGVYCVIFCFLLLNFLLAIIQVGFHRMQEKANMDPSASPLLLEDLHRTGAFYLKCLWNGWPSNYALQQELAAKSSNESSGMAPFVSEASNSSRKTNLSSNREYRGFIGLKELVATGLFRGRTDEDVAQSAKKYVLARRKFRMLLRKAEEARTERVQPDISNRRLMFEFSKKLRDVPELFIKEKAQDKEMRAQRMKGSRLAMVVQRSSTMHRTVHRPVQHAQAGCSSTELYRSSPDLHGATQEPQHLMQMRL